jgi:DNA-binding CsgD family transcriptional regulator
MITLTPQESRIINLMTEGLTVKEISERLNKTNGYVRVTLTRIRRQNKCKSSVQLVAKIFRENLYAE